MERVYLEWNVVNWVTIVLMASIGWLLLGVVSSALKARAASAREAVAS